MKLVRKWHMVAVSISMFMEREGNEGCINLQLKL